MDEDTAVVGPKVSVTAIVYSPCKMCGKGSTGPGTIYEAHRRANPDCPGYEESYPARELGVVAAGNMRSI